MLKRLLKENYLNEDNWSKRNTLENEFLQIALDNIDGMTYGEAYNFLMNDAEPSSGSVNGLIYYSETEGIAEDYYEDIIDLFCDIYGNKTLPYDLVQSLNNMTWAAWSFMVYGNEDNIEKILKIALKKKKITKG